MELWKIDNDDLSTRYGCSGPLTCLTVVTPSGLIGEPVESASASLQIYHLTGSNIPLTHIPKHCCSSPQLRALVHRVTTEALTERGARSLWDCLGLVLSN
jgi:hypothetical protein